MGESQSYVSGSEGDLSVSGGVNSPSRATILAILLLGYPDPVPVVRVRELMTSYYTTTDVAVRKALHDLVWYGLIERVHRGLYRVRDDRYSEVLTIALAYIDYIKIPNVKRFLNELSDRLIHQKSYEQLPRVTLKEELKDKEIVKNVKQIAKQRYGSRLVDEDLKVLEALTWVALRETSPYVQAGPGGDLVEAVRARVEAYTGSGIGVREVVESLRELRSLGLVYVYRGKVRVDKTLLEEAKHNAYTRVGSILS